MQCQIFEVDCTSSSYQLVLFLSSCRQQLSRTSLHVHRMLKYTIKLRSVVARPLPCFPIPRFPSPSCPPMSLSMDLGRNCTACECRTSDRPRPAWSYCRICGCTTCEPCARIAFSPDTTYLCTSCWLRSADGQAKFLDGCGTRVACGPCSLVLAAALFLFSCSLTA